MPDAQAEMLRSLHDEYGAALWAFALRGTRGDAAAAEDVVQETLLRAWRHIDALDPDQGSPRAWLYSVAHRVMIDGWRTSEETVAAFRFGTVEDSYAERRGKGRNIGVIGAAFFHERGGVAWRDLHQGDQADPFPKRFAPPPPARRF